MEQLKQQRKVQKGKMTRTLKLLKAECSLDEKDLKIITELNNKRRHIFEELERIHEQYGIEENDEERFTEAEEFMERCEEENIEVSKMISKVLRTTRAAEEKGQRADDGANVNRKNYQQQIEYQNNELENEPQQIENQNNELENNISNASNESGEMGEYLNNSNSNPGTEGSESVREVGDKGDRVSKCNNDFNMLSLKLALELPKAEIKEFHGDPLSYWEFISNFTTNVAAKLSNDSTRLQYLLQLCKGKAHICIKSCALLGEEGYVKALELLKKQFGQPHLVLNALMTNLQKRKQINPGDSEGLWTLVGAMKECQFTLSKLGYTSDLDSTSNLLRVQGLLPNYMQGKWVNKAHEILESREPTFLDLLEFVEKQAEIGSTMFGRQMGSASASMTRLNQKPDLRVKNYHTKPQNKEKK